MFPAALVVPSIIKNGFKIDAEPPGDDPEPALAAISKTLFPAVDPVSCIIKALPSLVPVELSGIVKVLSASSATAI